MKKNFFSLEQFDSFHKAGGDILSGIPTAVFGLSEEDQFFFASLFEAPVLFLVKDAVSGKRAAESISAFSGKKTVFLPAKDDVLLYKNALSKHSYYARLAALYEISLGAEVVVTTVESALQPVPKELKSVTFEKGKEYDYSSLPSLLVSLGYTREFEVESKGTFAIRGDILDLYPIQSENPCRVHFFGDEVEAIFPYDALSKERLPAINSLSVAAASDAFIQEDEKESLLATLKKGVKNSSSAAAFERRSAIAEEIEENFSSPASAAFLLPLLKNTTDLFTFLGDRVVLISEGGESFLTLEGILKEHFERCKNLSEGGEIFDFSTLQLLPEDVFLSRLSSKRRAVLQTFTGYVKFFAPLKTHNFKSAPVGDYRNDLPELFSDIRSWLLNGYRLIAFCGDSTRRDKLQEELSEEGISSHAVSDSLETLKGVSLTSETLERGLILHEQKLVLLGSGNLFHKSVREKKIKKRRGDVFTAPEVGDYAVHEVHGVGRVRGVERIETLDGTKEYIAVEYAAGDVLYVPVEQTDILTKYTGGDAPKLSKIGGQEFARVKERVRASLKKLAIDLKTLYSERQQKKGFAFPPREEEMDEFIAAFPFEDTPDQASSVKEILQDMSSEKVMDRLLCGDVGFGKTEVALRAVYLCVLGGKQAVLMCPSTILCQQHYSTAVERFRSFGVNVEYLNRFRSPKEQEGVLKALAEGKVDFLIGTHRLLSKDVKFKDLGLLVLDEEQRFGVEHKERLKTLKAQVDCLTMSATPIPRTLHMSLSGIRDISTIDTPPEHRIPVQTYVLEESESVIRDACLREIARGGQIFLLYNRVESIDSFAASISRILPEAQITIAHGRMDKVQLEKNVSAFYRGEKNLLITTTIIENGIDLPNANTLIVIDADRLGVSQLYQLRGRVGRGNRTAHAYFTFKPEKVLTQEASERLKAILEFTSLGSGFKIAMRDLQIRGAGNVLGAEQHGHMEKVGYELYSKLLQEEITGKRETTAELEIGATAFIPEGYIESSSGRMEAYKEIAEIRSMEDYERVYTSLKETYGTLPEEVFSLLIIAVLRSYAAKYDVTKIVVNRERAAVEFSSLNTVGDKGLTRAMEKFKGNVSLSMVSSPAIEFKPLKNPVYTMREMIKFLKYAQVSLS